MLWKSEIRSTLWPKVPSKVNKSKWNEKRSQGRFVLRNLFKPVVKYSGVWAPLRTGNVLKKERETSTQWKKLPFEGLLFAASRRTPEAVLQTAAHTYRPSPSIMCRLLSIQKRQTYNHFTNTHTHTRLSAINIKERTNMENPRWFCSTSDPMR